MAHTATPEVSTDPQEAARQAGLLYTSDTRPGIERRKTGKHFTYRFKGETVRDPKTLERIKKLVIPPAWTEVWISPNPRGHVQATGRDARGRKQYKYHEKWREVRDETKYTRIIGFAETLPAIRARVEKEMKLPGLPRETVLATVVRLLETTLIRVGNEDYVKANQSYGLTTLRNKHLKVEGTKLHFAFKGKSGKKFQVSLQDRRLASIVKKCQDLPGQELFEYLEEDGSRKPIQSTDVNDYLREITGQDYTAKDFRTWHGTVLAVCALRELGNAVAAVKRVSESLNNTPAVCKKCYIHPAVLEAFVKGEPMPQERDVPEEGLSRGERAVLNWLKTACG